MTSSVDYSDKIAKLLSKAESTTEAEAEALRERAYALMTKYAVDQAEIDAKRNGADKSAEKIVTDKIVFTGIYKDALVQMAHSIVMAFGTMNGYVTKNAYACDYDPNVTDLSKGNVYFIVGYESDVKQTRLLIASLQLQAVSALSEWWRNDDIANLLRTMGSNMEKFKARREFIMSFGHGAGSRIRDAHRKEFTQRGSGAELVLRDRRTEVDAWMEENTKLRKSGGRMKRGAAAATQSGYAAGRRANTGDKGVSDANRGRLS